MCYDVEHYTNLNNCRREEVLSMMLDYNEAFSEFDRSLEGMVNKYLVEENVQGWEAMEIYYEELCDELVVIVCDGEVVAFRFVEFDENDQYFRKRVDNYEPGLNLILAIVDEQHRKNGLWSMMLDFVENNILPKYDTNRLYLSTASKNESMQKAAEKNGFIEVSRVKNERGENNDTIIYSKTS